MQKRVDMDRLQELEITMTTRGRIVIAANTSQPNDVFQFSGPTPLAAVGWLFRRPPREAHMLAFSAAGTAALVGLPSCRLWLLASHSSPQPNSVLVRHRRLWSALEARGLRIPDGERTDEFSNPSENGLRWSGAIRLFDRAQLPLVAALVEAEPAALLIAIQSVLEHEVVGIVRAGWSYLAGNPPPEIMTWLGGREALVFWPVGAFDDPESGVVALGPMRLTEALVHAD